jgi:flagellar biosynthesis anti-sigma factor FlgM
MKIHGHKPPESADAVRHLKAGKHGSARPSGGTDTKDKVDLSGNAKELADLVNVAKSLPEVRTEKVASIRSDIAAGKYVVEPAVIARKMVDEIV